MTPPRRPLLRAITGGASAPPPVQVYTDTELFEGIANGDERIAR